MKKFIKQTLLLNGRIMKHITRSPDTIITVAIMPIAIMLLFVYVLGGAIKPSLPDGTNYVTYILPAILVMTISSSIAYVSFRIFTDKQKGITTRFQSMPVSRSAVLWGHVLSSVISISITIAIVLLVALAMGFRSGANALQWFAFIGMVLLIILAFTWLAIIPGLKAKSSEGVSVYSYPLIFLPFLSSAFVPLETLPKALRYFAEYQPFTPIIETLRSLLIGGSAGNNLWIALAWCVGLTIVAYFFAVRSYKKNRK